MAVEDGAGLRQARAARAALRRASRRPRAPARRSAGDRRRRVLQLGRRGRERAVLGDGAQDAEAADCSSMKRSLRQGVNNRSRAWPGGPPRCRAMRLHAIPHSTNVDRVAARPRPQGRRPVEGASCTTRPTARALARALGPGPRAGAGDRRRARCSPTRCRSSRGSTRRGRSRRCTRPIRSRAARSRAFIDVLQLRLEGRRPTRSRPSWAGRARPGRARRWAAQLRGLAARLRRRCSCGRDFLFGDAPGAADVCAYPFLSYATSTGPRTTTTFPRRPDRASAPGAALPNLPDGSTDGRPVHRLRRPPSVRIEPLGGLQARGSMAIPSYSHVHLLPEHDPARTSAGRFD